MVDVHCHLQFEAFQEDYDQVIQAAFKSGITKIINVGTRIESSQKAVEFAEKYDNLFAIVGVHPHHADKLNVIARKNDEAISSNLRLPRSLSVARNDKDDWLKQLEQLAKHPKVLAIGEIGLDYYSYKSNGIVDPVLQKKLFVEQIKLAHKVGLPLQIHNRHAGADIIETLKAHKHLLLPIPGMFHCFAGDKKTLETALELGFYIGFDGNITYKGLAPGETVTLSELAKLTPLERIVIETDSPYLTPLPYRGKRNEPKHAIITAEFVANLKGVTYEELVIQTDKNAYNIFRKLK